MSRVMALDTVLKFLVLKFYCGTPFLIDSSPFVFFVHQAAQTSIVKRGEQALTSHMLELAMMRDDRERYRKLRYASGTCHSDLFSSVGV